MIGSLIGAGIGAAASIIGGSKARKAARKANRMLEGQKAENQAWYDRRYNEDATQRADAQSMLTMTIDLMRRRNKAAAGTAAVMGSSPEAVAVEKEANAQALADTASQIAAAGAARKDQVENQYLAQRNALTQQQIGVQNQQAGNIGQAAAGVGQAAMGAGMAYDQMKEENEQNKRLNKLLGIES